MERKKRIRIGRKRKRRERNRKRKKDISSKNSERRIHEKVLKKKERKYDMVRYEDSRKENILEKI